ncbi:hypothetical protein [Shinella sumterensis]|jgi:hypothetical protein|uniref:Uncharacterized protein n=1 Tax=Shinella sumterensis TaxID=1967501 RepID=A0AA50HBY5_9HYPH|nr:hypothetical protein [Shinella sumterensis]TXH84909.1 MAG: hypothetical protein E6Q77_01520 [Rhizobium sp.]WLS01375.1 hypothetical protein Q9313_28675 [Shinella sumterensis]
MKRLILALLITAAPIAVYADYSEHIASQEGGNSYSIFNTNGGSAVGKYQITAGTWANLGYFQYNGSGSKGDWSNYSVTDKGRAAGVNSLNDLRFSAAGASLQDRANLELASQNWASMSSSTRGLVGQTINGVTVTQEGLLSASHFLGAGALNDWVASGFDPSALPASYLTANGFSSYAELQNYIMKRMASANGQTYAGLDGSDTGGASGEGMYDATSNFPGLGTKRPVLIREVPPFQGERQTL